MRLHLLSFSHNAMLAKPAGQFLAAVVVYGIHVFGSVFECWTGKTTVVSLGLVSFVDWKFFDFRARPLEVAADSYKRGCGKKRRRS